MRAIFGLMCLAAACGYDPSEPRDPAPGEITVAVSSPAPGDQLVASEQPSIAVAGTVTTTSPDYGVLEAWVNGERVPVQADGSFTTELAPVPGINHLKVEGGDGVGALVPGGEMDVMWASDYLAPLAGTTGFDLPGALELSLGQRFLDARPFGTALDLTADPVVAGDLTSALELILWHVDLAGLLDGGIQIGDGINSVDIAIPSATPASIVVDARIIDTPERAIQLDIELLGVFVAMDGTFQFDSRTLVIEGGIAADMHASARLALAAAPDGSIEVVPAPVTATVGPLVPSFAGDDGDELDALITLGGNDFRLLVQELIGQELIPAFTERVPPLLEGLLGAADDVLDDVSFMLDPRLGSPVTLELDGRVGGLDVVPGAAVGSQPGHLTVRQDVAIRTSGAAIHPASRGAPRIEATLASGAAATSGLRLAIRLDFLNALLHALWNAGLLEGQATFAGLSAIVSAKLPPVVRSTPLELACEIDGERCDVTLQLGQLEVTLPDFQQSFAIAASAGARIAVDGATVSIIVQDAPTVHVWETSEVPGTLQPATVRDTIANVVWPALFGAIGDNLTVALPLPDLAELGLTELAPGLADAKLELLVRHRPSVSGGYISLDADLALETPQP